jgi:hypothetical protein
MTPRPGTIVIRPVLYHSPMFYERHWWTDAAHQWDWVTEDTAIDAKPFVDLEVSLNDTLGDALETACAMMGFDVGTDGEMHGHIRNSQIGRIGFVNPDRDLHGVDHEILYKWPHELTVAREDGHVEDVPWREVTFRELLASSALGLVEGDVTRPYIYTGIPQGNPSPIVELARISVEMIHDAYRDVESSAGAIDRTIHLLRHATPGISRYANSTMDEGTRIYTAYKLSRWIRSKLGKSPKT